MPSGAHAILSASSAARWLACPPSARLNEKLNGKFGEGTSPFAAEGTKAHALAEIKLRNKSGEINDFNYETRRRALGDIPDDMETATNYYVDIVLEKFYEAKRCCPDAKLLLEQKLDFSNWVPSGFGTGDAVIVSDASLEVIDYKHGAGVAVSAEDNPQIRLYALGAINAFGELYGFETVRGTIVQPRRNNVTEETNGRKDLLAWGESVRPVAQLAWTGDGEYLPGDHCRFCAARAICAARAAKAMHVYEAGFAEPGLLSDQQIADILAVADTTEAWLKDVRTYATAMAQRGEEVPGFKLVHGKKTARTWRSDEEVRQQLIRAGYPEDAITVTRLRTVSEMEKSIGRSALRTFLGPLISQGEGALTLVPNSDAREAVTSAEVDFADIINNNDDNS